MAKVKKPVSYSGSQRVSPLKPGLRGARNWASAQVRAASHTRKGFLRLIASILGVLIAIVIFGFWLSGDLPKVRQSLSDFKRDRIMAMGFVVERVDVMGEGRLREQDVRKALGVYEGDYLFGVDMDGAKRRVESLSWVDRAVVRRLWPDRIVVQIIERQPYALWQSQGQVQVVDVKGELITDADPMRYTDLKLFVGRSAKDHISDVESEFSEFPLILNRITSFVHVSDTRWDLILNDGAMRVKLPNQPLGTLLPQLEALQLQEQIFDREISVIDMRLPDRLTLTPAVRERA